MQSCYPHHHAVICSAQQDRNLRPAPHVLATARLHANMLFLCLDNFLVSPDGDIGADGAVVGSPVAWIPRINTMHSKGMLSAGMTRLYDANFPVQGIMRVDASHKGSSPAHQPQFNKAAHAMRANPVLPRS